MDNDGKIKPVSEIPEGICSSLEFVFTDIDDTITEDGMMPPETLEAVYRLDENGIKVVLVTGRPAGWCDYFARMWPVAAVVGENGAFYFSYDRGKKKMSRVYLVSEEERSENRKRLDVLKEEILRAVPGCRISADQPFRIADLAVDISEDVEPLGSADVDRICEIAGRAGAAYKISSIHVNCWFGEYDKLTCFGRFISDYTGKPISEVQERIVYVGDSPNDGPMFAGLKYSVAVANIKKYLDNLDSLPAFVTENPAAGGFSEFVGILLRKRKS